MSEPELRQLIVQLLKLYHEQIVINVILIILVVICLLLMIVK